jgi:hypothetical protein
MSAQPRQIRLGAFLQARGFLRSEYAGPRLRENLGLERPANSLARPQATHGAVSLDLAQAAFG